LVAETLLIRIAVLADDRGHPLGVLHRQLQADRRAVVEDIHCIASEADRIDETTQHPGELVEAVGELSPWRSLGLAEPRKVRRDHAVAVRQQRDQVAKHMARGREAVQKQEDRCIGTPGFAVEDIDIADHHPLIVDGDCRLLRRVRGGSGKSGRDAGRRRAFGERRHDGPARDRGRWIGHGASLLATTYMLHIAGISIAKRPA
jgi:hypothetical protein